MERQPVIEALPGKSYEVVHGDGGELGIEKHHDVAFGSRNRRLVFLSGIDLH